MESDYLPRQARDRRKTNSRERGRVVIIIQREARHTTATYSGTLTFGCCRVRERQKRKNAAPFNCTIPVFFS